MSNCNVSIHADGHEMKDRSSAGPDIHGEPDKAKMTSKHPTVHNLINGRERKHQNT